jgi:hypothetical protein
MARQLVLIETSTDAQWRLDDSTRELGRRGVAEARRALRDATRESAAVATANPQREHSTAA